MSFSAVLAFSLLRAVKNNVAPVEDNARAVSNPMPDDAPVMTITLPPVCHQWLHLAQFEEQLVVHLQRLVGWHARPNMGPC